MAEAFCNSGFGAAANHFACAYKYGHQHTNMIIMSTYLSLRPYMYSSLVCPPPTCLYLAPSNLQV